MVIAKVAAKPAKRAPPAKSAFQTTVALKHLAAELADSHEVAKKQAEAVLGDLVTLTTRHLKKGAKIRLTDLGILQVRPECSPEPRSLDRRAAEGDGIAAVCNGQIDRNIAEAGVAHRHADGDPCGLIAAMIADQPYFNRALRCWNAASKRSLVASETFGQSVAAFSEK